MKKIHKTSLYIIFIFIILLSYSSCKGVGIFAFIATTEKIESGLLPTGLGASGIINIKQEYDVTNYDYFSTGSALFRKNTLNRSISTSWSTVSLPSGWTNIQSVTASDNKILLALSKSSETSLSVGLFTYSNAEGFRSITDSTSLLSNSDGYVTVQLYCPNPSTPTDTFYVNILKFSGTFGKESTFSGSTLYILDDFPIQITKADEAEPTWATTLKSSYISSAAYSGTSYRFTTISTSSDINNITGKLTDKNGNTITGTITDAEKVVTSDTTPPLPSGALTWLPYLNAYIMSSVKTSDGNYHIYISTDGGIGNNWKILPSNYYITCFLDVSNTQAGGRDPGGDDYSPPNKLILAGTRSTLSWNYGTGYLEIVAGENSRVSPLEWTLRTTKSTFTFAQSNSYISGDLSSVGISALTILKEGINTTGDQYVYASTYNSGIWRLNADDNAALLNNELIWLGE